MKRKNKFLIILAIIITATLILIINIPLDKQIISTKFIAGERMGFDLGPDNLNFGNIVPGQSASRDITIANNFDFPIIIKIKSSGKISDYIIVSENNFHLQSNESKEIIFSAFPEKNIELKEYSGEIIIITKKL